MRLDVLRTERLRLVPLDAAHSAGMFELWSSPAVCEFSGTADDLDGKPVRLPAQDPSDSDKIIRFFEAFLVEGKGCRWAVLDRADQRFLGLVGFNRLGPTCELAYHLLPAHWGHGYMGEACRAALQWASSSYPGCLFEAYIEPGNRPSIVLAERLGFERADELREGARRYHLEAAGGRSADGPR